MRIVRERRAPSFPFPTKIEQFVSKLDTMETSDLDQFLLLGPQFDELLRDRCVWTELLNSALAYVASGETAEEIQAERLVLLSAAGQVMLTTGPVEVGVQTVALKENKEFLANPGCHLMVGFLSDEPMAVRRFRLFDEYQFDVFDPDARLELVDEFELPPRERLTIDGNREVVQFDTETEETCALIAGSQWTTSQIWSFSSDLVPLGASLTSLSSSILISMLEEISRTRFAGAADQVFGLLEHPDHNVRWAAVKSLGAIDSKLTMRSLERLVADPHPHVRRAAERTLVQAREVETC